jgi:CRP-like cAMP-binding protein
VLLNKLAAIDEFSHEAKIAKTLRIKIRSSIKTAAEFEGFKWTDKKDFFAQLPIKLRHEIALTMHKGCALSLNFFKYRNLCFISSVVPFLSHMIVNKDCFVYSAGEFSDAVYFLLRGKVGIMKDLEDSNIEIRKILPGGDFGQLEVIQQIPRKYSAVAMMKSSLLVMDYTMVDSIKCNFPEIWENTVAEALENDRIMELVIETVQELNKNSSDELQVKTFKEINELIEETVVQKWAKPELWDSTFEQKTTDEILSENIESITKSVESISEISENVENAIKRMLQSKGLEISHSGGETGTPLLSQ